MPLEPAVDPRFAPGERVRVRRMRPDGHTRCPRYVRGADRRRRSGPRHRRAARHRALQGPERAGLRGRVRLRGAVRAVATRAAGPSCSTSSRATWSGVSTNTTIEPRSRALALSAARARGAAGREGPALDRRDRRRRRALRARPRPAARRARRRAGVGRPGVPRAPARRRRRPRSRELGYRRVRGRHAGRRREHAGRPQRRRVHALLVLPVAAARAAAHLVQEPGLPRPRRRRAARGARASSASSCRDGRRDPRLGLDEPRCATSSLPERPAGTDGIERGGARRRSSRATA